MSTQKSPSKNISPQKSYSKPSFVNENIGYVNCAWHMDRKQKLGCNSSPVSTEKWYC